MRTRGVATVTIVLVYSFALTACGGDANDARAQASATVHIPTTTSSIATTTVRTTTTLTAPSPATAAIPSTTPITRASPSAAAPPTAAPTTAAPAPLLVDRITGTGSARQVIAVAADGYGTSLATLTAYERGASGWKQVFGPWSSYIGRNGVAPAGTKREGDGRTPSGVFGFDFMFGVDPNPGVHFPFRPITGPNIVWDDDPSSANYNEWIDRNAVPAGMSPEPMDNTPSYNYGAVIGYNDARTPGLGSAIFLHVSHGSSTAGCVSLPTDELLALLRWLDPSRTPRIAIGTVAALQG